MTQSVFFIALANAEISTLVRIEYEHRNFVFL